MELLRQFNINPLWLFGESYNKIVNINGGDVSPKVITLDVDQNDTIALVNQKAAAGYPHNVQDVEWYETLPHLIYLFPNTEMQPTEVFK
jgi:hypothetical protein